MDARMTLQDMARNGSDRARSDNRRAAILSMAGLPDAPLVMPRQVIQVSQPSIIYATQNAARRLYSLMTEGFGPAARGR